MKQPVDLPIPYMVPLDSFFVPCVDVEEVKKEAKRIAKELNYEIRMEKVVYNGMYGLRIWRL